MPKIEMRIDKSLKQRFETQVTRLAQKRRKPVTKTEVIMSLLVDWITKQEINGDKP